MMRLALSLDDPVASRLATLLTEDDLPRRVERVTYHGEPVETIPPGTREPILYVSRHQARKRQPVFTVHSLAIPSEDHPTGGLVPTDAHLLTRLYTFLSSMLREEPLTTPFGSYSVSLEASHHGPLSPYESIFLELGTHEEHWQDEAAIRWLARMLTRFLHSYQPGAERERVFLIGGNHYCASAERILPHADLAGCLPKHTASLIGKRILTTLHAWYDLILLDWDGLPGGEKQRLAKLADDLHINWMKLKEWRRQHA